MPLQIENDIQRVRQLIRDLFEQSPFAPLLDDPSTLLTNQGRMLRARLGIRLGRANSVPEPVIHRTAAAIELIHAASLLHDDVIDNGHIRRNAPAYWEKNGTAGAILLGDLLVFYALKLLTPLRDPRLGEALIRYLGEVGEAEVLQEIIHRGEPQSWNDCIQTARRKTGPLFAFMGFMAGGPDEALSDLLAECGYLVGSAYQLADDLLDAYGDADTTDKSLGRDLLRGKHTTARFAEVEHIDPIQCIHELCGRASALLQDHPALQSAWHEYLDADILPVIRGHLRLVPHGGSTNPSGATL